MPDSQKGSTSEQNEEPGATDDKRNSMVEKVVDLDYVLINELGQFGHFQMINLLFICIPIILTATVSEYIFTTAAIPYRCMIPECGETTENAVYNTESLLAAIPVNASCERFMPLETNGSLEYCPSNMFSLTETIECSAYVYEKINSVVYDFSLECQSWLRVLPGALVSVGTLLALPFISYISDRWGRRTALLVCVFNLGFMGLIRAFSVNYAMFVTMQLLHSTLGSGSFSTSYILATELVGPKYRVFTSATCSSMFALGQVIMAAVAWLIQPWRNFAIAIHIPCFLVLISYPWLLSESVRWLLSKGKFDKARITLEKVSKANKRLISEKSMQSLMEPPPPPVKIVEGPGPGLVKTILKSRVLLRRVCTTPIWWVSATLVYYGLSINSTALPVNNMYMTYMLTCGIEIPGFYTAILVLDRIGRKATLSGGYFLSAMCNIGFAFMPERFPSLGLVVYLVGKFGISVVFTSLYLYTSELYPTQYRHRLLAFSSMIGRIGSIIAPLTPALADIWSGIPSMMFCAMAALSGLLVLTQPETLGTKMPDTLAEAEALGSPESKLKQPS